MPKSSSVDNAYVAYRKALQDFYGLQPEPESRRTRGFRKVSSVDFGQRSQSLLDQSRNFGDTLVTALVTGEPDKRELLGWKLLAAAASDLSTASYMLEVPDADLKSDLKFRTRSAFEPMSSLKEILEVPVETGINAFTKPVTRRVMSNNPEAAKEKLRQTIAIFLDEIPDAAASMSETAADKVISAGLIPAKHIVSDLAGQILKHLPAAASIVLKHAALLLAEAVRKIEAALGKVVTERVKEEVTSWLNEIIIKHDTVTKLLNRLYETRRIREELNVFLVSAPENMPANRYNIATKTLENLLARYSMTKKVLEGVMKVLGFVETPLLAAVPWGPIAIYGTYSGVLAYAIFSGGDYLDWYRLEDKAWLDRVSGLRTTVRNSLKKEELKKLRKGEKNGSGGKIVRVSIRERGQSSIPILHRIDNDGIGRKLINTEIGESGSSIVSQHGMKGSEINKEFPGGGINRIISKGTKVNANQKVKLKVKKSSGEIVRLKKKKKSELIEEKIRLDVQTPEKVVVQRTFNISVAIRQPKSPLPKDPDLPKVVSKNGKTFRKTSKDIIKYRVNINAPDCEVYNKRATFLLKPGSDSEAHYFQLKAKTEGIISILVQAYQEDGLLSADTHISITASIEAKPLKSEEDQDMNKTKILFFASNPQNTNVLDLGEEARSITRKIREAEYRDSLEFVTAWAARPTDLLDEMSKHNPEILHFSGHGAGKEGLVFTNDQGEPKLVSTIALKTLFSTVKNDIRLVVLNACFSAEQGRAISRVIECVVGMNKSIGDEAAILFAAYFYSAIAYGRSVKDAFEQGKVTLMLLGIPEEKTPVLLCRKGIDPSNIYLVHANEVDYSKIQKIDNDGTGNITLKDINGSTVTVNYNDIEKIKSILQNLSDTQTFEVKQLIGSQHKETLTEIRKIQEQTDEKNTNQKAEKILNGLDDFFKELTALRIEGAKNRIITNYKLLREYEEMIILEDDPKLKMKYQKEIEKAKYHITTDESELKSIIKQP